MHLNSFGCNYKLFHKITRIAGLGTYVHEYLIILPFFLGGRRVIVRTPMAVWMTECHIIEDGHFLQFYFDEWWVGNRTRTYTRFDLLSPKLKRMGFYMAWYRAYKITYVSMIPYWATMTMFPPASKVRSRNVPHTCTIDIWSIFVLGNCNYALTRFRIVLKCVCIWKTIYVNQF